MNIEKLHQKGINLFKNNKLDKAMKIAKDLQRIAPDSEKGYYLESAIYHKRKELVNEYHALEKVVSLMDMSSPEKRNFVSEILANLGMVCLNLCLVDKAYTYFYMASTLANNKMISYNMSISVFMTASYSEYITDTDFNILHNRYKKQLADTVPYPRKFYDHRKIRVGFLSADFKRHSVMYFSWHLILGLNKQSFDVYCYSNVQKSDDITEKVIKNVTVYRDITKLKDEEAAKLIRDDEIDILFDLSGYTSGERIRVAAYHPASAQISGIGYIGSSGLDCFDYFLSDVYCTEDVAATSQYFTEKVIQMPHCHICYSPLRVVEHASEPPCIKNGYITFGCFNNFSKVTDSMLSTWKKILDAVPDSRLLLKHVQFLQKDVKQFIGERMERYGIDLKRVEMRGWSETHPLDYNDMDIALDTYPYTGCVTTCEALYMGVPVVSLYGDRHGTRMSYSTLKNVGLDELAVKSYDEYVNRAVALANDWDLIAVLRRNLRTMMEQSPLMDSKGYLRAIQRVFVSILDYERKKYESEQNQ